MAAVRDKGLGLIGWGPVSQALRQRASFAGLDALSISALADSLEIWLEPLLPACRGLRDIGDRKLADALMADRKSVVVGQSVSVRVDLGGRRFIKKKKTKTLSN